MSSSQQQQQQTTNPSFGGPNTDLTARLQAPVSPTSTTNSAAANEARRRTSEWKPSLPGRTFSFDREEHKHAMMVDSGALSPIGAGAGAGVGIGVSGAKGFSERA